MFVGLTGPPGSGKTSVARYLDSLTPDEISPELTTQGYTSLHGIPMRQLLRWHGYDGSNRLQDLQTYHSELRRVGEATEVLERLRRLKSGIVIVDSLRRASDAAHFIHSMGGYIIALNAPLNICRQRYITDNGDEKHSDVLNVLDVSNIMSNEQDEYVLRVRERSWDQAASEIFADDDTNPGISSCMKMARFTIDAVGSKMEVATRAADCIRQLI